MSEKKPWYEVMNRDEQIGYLFCREMEFKPLTEKLERMNKFILENTGNDWDYWEPILDEQALSKDAR